MRVLVVEDNAPVAESIRTMLEARKYAANVVTDGAAGLDHLLRRCYDAAVIDVGLPGMDGFSLARNARAEGVQTPILMLTARDAVEDRVAGLELRRRRLSRQTVRRRGARRADRGDSAPQRTGRCSASLKPARLRIDLAARNVIVRGKPVVLGATEFRLLEFLARNAGIALSRTQIVERIWDYDFEGSSNIVDVYVSQLRRKLKGLGASGVIETVWGIGYRLKTR